jgi:hypothetical protein
MKKLIAILGLLLLVNVVTAQEPSPVQELYENAGIALDQAELERVETLVANISWLMTALEISDKLTLEAVAYGDTSCMRDVSIERWDALQGLLNQYLNHIEIGQVYTDFRPPSDLELITANEVQAAIDAGELVSIDAGEPELVLVPEAAEAVSDTFSSLPSEVSSQFYVSGATRAEYQTRIWRLCSLAVPNDGFAVEQDVFLNQHSLGIGFTFAYTGSAYNSFLAQVRNDALTNFPVMIEGEWYPPTIKNLIMEGVLGTSDEVLSSQITEDLGLVCQTLGENGIAVFDLTGWFSTELRADGTIAVWQPINPVFAGIYVGEPVLNPFCNFAHPE